MNKKYCDISYCEGEAYKTVAVSVNGPSDETRRLCAACEEAYTIGVQHGRMTAKGETVMKQAKAKDPEIIEMNAKRAGWAQVAVEAFARETGLIYDEDEFTAIYDLIVDLIHLCDVKNLNFVEIVDRAKGCYEEEQVEL